MWNPRGEIEPTDNEKQKGSLQYMVIGKVTTKPLFIEPVIVKIKQASYSPKCIPKASLYTGRFYNLSWTI